MKQSKMHNNYEGIHLSMMKAVACGKTCCCDECWRCAFLVKNGVNGIVISPGKADQLAESMIYLAENPELRKPHGRSKCQENVKEYDWNNIAKQYHTLYLKILAC